MGVEVERGAGAGRADVAVPKRVSERDLALQDLELEGCFFLQLAGDAGVALFQSLVAELVQQLLFGLRGDLGCENSSSCVIEELLGQQDLLLADRSVGGGY